MRTKNTDGIMKYTGVVEEVRVFYQNKFYGTSNQASNAVPDALIGGIIAGMTGAVVGYATGAEDDARRRQQAQQDQRFVTDPVICKLFVTISNKIRLEFIFRQNFFGYATDPLINCTLLRTGDSILISYDENGQYIWQGHRELDQDIGEMVGIAK